MIIPCLAIDTWAVSIRPRFRHTCSARTMMMSTGNSRGPSESLLIRIGPLGISHSTFVPKHGFSEASPNFAQLCRNTTRLILQGKANSIRHGNGSLGAEILSRQRPFSAGGVRCGIVVHYLAYRRMKPQHKTPCRGVTREIDDTTTWLNRGGVSSTHPAYA